MQPGWKAERESEWSPERPSPVFGCCGPTFHAFGWVYRAPLMRKLLSSFKKRKPLLNPLDVWVWEVMAAQGMLGCALSPDVLDYSYLARSTEPKPTS